MTIPPAIAAYSFWVDGFIGARLRLDDAPWVTYFRFATLTATYHASFFDVDSFVYVLLLVFSVDTAGWVVTIFFGIELVGFRCAHADLSTVEVLTQ